MEDMKLGFVMKYRSLPCGKGDGGIGLNDFDTNFGSLIELLLRRTLVLSDRCSAIISRGDRSDKAAQRDVL